MVTAQSDASGVLSPNDYLLAYGYLVQQRSGDTDSDSNPRTIGVGKTGTVTISYQIPKDASVSYSFSATFSLRTSSSTDMVQTQEEQLAGTIAGQTGLTNLRFVTIPGGQACGTTTGTGTSLNFINQLRIAGKVGGTGIDNPIYAFNTPSIASTVTSSSDSGAGSLRDTIAGALPDTGICLQNNLTLSSQITIAKNLSIYGGNNVVLSGNNTTRVFEVTSSFTVGLHGFTISGGRKTADITNVGGDAIVSAGTLNLNGMKINNNRFDGGFGLPMTPNLNADAKGGAIYNSSSGVLNITYSELKSNTVSGAGGTPALPGFPAPGESGGNANGGAIYNQGTLSIGSSQINTNVATGGNGGTGGMGSFTQIQMPPPAPPMIICIMPAGAGGNGGNASGGGVFSTVAFTNNTNIISNTVNAGSGGFAGGPPPCSTAQSFNGTAGNANVVP